MQNRWLRILSAVSLIVFCAGSLLGQGGRASISGVVLDTSGAAVPGASITATNNGTGLKLSVFTTDSGSYVIPLLQIGSYSISVRKDGFRTETRTGITLTADQEAALNFSLTVGQVSDEVRVSADAELLETTSSALGQVITERSIVELPLNGRNPASLVLLTPGTVDVLKTGAGVLQGYTTFPTETGASSNGGRQGSTFYMLDGAVNMDNYHLLAAPFPNADATQEFRVVGNNFEAQYGFAPGAVVSIATKSGTNQWHGNGYEFMRNEKLNARDFFQPTRDNLKRNQFGGSIGGPIVKDKLFVFGNYQGTTERRKVGGSTAFVPSTAMLGGDFSGLGVTIKDPDTGVPIPDGKIAVSRLSPAALKIAQSLPSTTDPQGKVTVVGFTSQQNYHEFTTRADYYANAQHRFSGRTFLNDFAQPIQALSLLTSDRSWESRWQNHSGSWLWTAKPNILNSLTFSYTRLNSTSVSGLRDKDGKSICYSQLIEVVDPPNSPCSIEGLFVGGSFGIGQNYNAIRRYTVGVNESLTINKGRHLVVAGVDVMRQYWDLATDWLALPIISFDGSVTGHELSDFMTGRVSNYLQGGGEYQRLHATQIGSYVQDQIKVKPNLTLNLGIRWEPFFAPVPSSGRIPVWAPGKQSQRYKNAPVGLLFPGDPGVSDAGLPSGKGYFDPRVGIAWQPSFLKHTSIRAAFGIFTAPVDYSSWNHTADTAPFSPTFNFNATDPGVKVIPFDRPWANYAPTGFKSPFPPFPDPGASPDGNVGFVTPVFFQGGWDQNFKLGRNQSWNMSIEHQLASNWLVRAAYVGSEAFHLVNAIERNPGIYGLLGGRSFTNFQSVLEMQSATTSSYQSGQFTIEKRFSRGLQFQSNYTYSKSLDAASIGTLAFTGSVADPFNLRNNRGWAAFHIPHVWISNFVWELPKLQGMNPIARNVIGGWQVSGIWRMQNGNPFGIRPGSGGNRSLSQIGADRADYVPGQAITSRQGDKNSWLNNYFTKSAFQVNAPGTFGNTPRALFFAPPIATGDAGISKNWAFAERYRLQFRWEMFNVFNTPSFAAPNNSVTSNQFGRILSTGGVPPRVMQGALKFYW
jgi:hypothetical protein